MSPTQSKTRLSLRRQMWGITAASVVLVFGVGGWAATTEFSGAVIAQGQLVVDSNVKKVQHPTGGVVSEIGVRDGSKVDAGQIVMRLDDTQTRANLSIIIKALDELTARQAREEAERDGAAKIAFPEMLIERLSDPDVARTVNGERVQFEVRRQTRNGYRQQLRERIAQLNEEISGYESQINSKAKQIGWIIKELEGVNTLWEQNLVPYTRVTTLERERERLEGERGQLIAAIAQSRGKIAETEIQTLQIDQDMRAEVSKDLADIRGKISELVEKKVAAEDQLKRIDIRAPQAGYVHQLSVHTVGGVVAPGEQTMLIVPTAEILSVEVRIQPQDIDQVHMGQTALLRFTSFSQRTTPEIFGTVTQISADTSEDQKSGIRFYTLRLAVAPNEVARLGNIKLVPGMPVEAFVQTSPRTVMSFLLKPLGDQIAHTFREK